MDTINVNYLFWQELEKGINTAAEYLHWFEIS